MLKRIVLHDPSRTAPLVFEKPEQVFLAVTPEDVVPAMRAAEAALRERDGYVAGYVSFDAATAFDASFLSHRDTSLPLLCLGFFSGLSASSPIPPRDHALVRSTEWQLNTDAEAFENTIANIHAEIERGNTYQINYTMRYRSNDQQSAHQLYAELGARARYGALLELDTHDVVSASPELFFDLDGEHIRCKPMKGTAMRGLSRLDDLQRRDALARSQKDRAENIMITDMVRNDLGRIALPGSVLVKDLCSAEQHPTVWQMTSTVQAKTRASLTDIFTAMFPSASVTGAPKTASLKIIHALEDTPRGMYTGAIGYISSERRAQFNVAIRTASIDKRTGLAEYGVGSGIIWDSVAKDEFRECQLKAEILASRHQHPAFALVETMHWSRSAGVARLDAHLERLEESAGYFARPFSRDRVRAQLEEVAGSIEEDACRLRLLLEENGDVKIGSSTLPQTPKPFRLRLASRPVDQDDPFLFHKTTHRNVYSEASAGTEDCDDVLLWNNAGLITETTIANVFLKRDGKWVTPPIDCGLLGGVMRDELLKRADFVEGPIHRNELRRGEELLLCNALRGEFFGTFLG